jgi:hypothetical protein
MAGPVRLSGAFSLRAVSIIGFANIFLLWRTDSAERMWPRAKFRDADLAAHKIFRGAKSFCRAQTFFQREKVPPGTQRRLSLSKSFSQGT